MSTTTTTITTTATTTTTTTTTKQQHNNSNNNNNNNNNYNYNNSTTATTTTTILTFWSRTSFPPTTSPLERTPISVPSSGATSCCGDGSARRQVASRREQTLSGVGRQRWRRRRTDNALGGVPHRHLAETSGMRREEPWCYDVSRGTRR